MTQNSTTRSPILTMNQKEEMLAVSIVLVAFAMALLFMAACMMTKCCSSRHRAEQHDNDNDNHSTSPQPPRSCLDKFCCCFCCCFSKRPGATPREYDNWNDVLFEVDEADPEGAVIVTIVNNGDNGNGAEIQDPSAASSSRTRTTINCSVESCFPDILKGKKKGTKSKKPAVAQQQQQQEPGGGDLEQPLLDEAKSQ
jgi:hypothetical protein